MYNSSLKSKINEGDIHPLRQQLLNSIKKNNLDESFSYLKYFIGFSIVLLIVYYVYRIIQDDLIVRIRQYTRMAFLKTVLKMNNENMGEKNYMRISSPINRLSTVSFSILNEIITFVVPTCIFLIVIFYYLSSIDFQLGLIFIFANLLIFFYMYIVIPSIIKKNKEYETQSFYNENYQLELLSNMDKVIYRGQVNPELDIFHEISEKTNKIAYDFYFNADTHNLIVNSIVNICVFVILYFAIQSYYKKKITSVMVITIITIILLYKERMASMIQQIIDFIEFVGRGYGVMHFFEDIKDLNEFYKYAVFVPLFAYSLMFVAITWHPQWIIIMCPFLALSFMFIKQRKMLLTFEALAMIALTWYVVNAWCISHRRLNEHDLHGSYPCP
jgi:ABC-type bacteriocin/lantibiotic exporter with double-glycine peptidase domain